MKSKKLEIMTTLLLILLCLEEIFGAKELKKNSESFQTKEKNFPRKLQTDNYIILNFGDNFVSDTCWFSNFDNKISSVEIDDVQRSDYTSGISLTSGNIMKIHFNSNLDELKYFLGYNSVKSSIYSSNCQNSGAFTLRSHITSIDLSHLITESVTSTSNMFNGFSSLKIVNLEGFDASSLVSMDYMFSGCSSLHTIIFSDLAANGVTNMEGMFNGCSSLTSVSLTKIIANQVNNMKHMFNGCSALKLIDLTYVFTWNVDPSNMEYIFNDCTSLIALFIPNFYMSQISTENHMFDNVNKLKYIDIEYMHKSHLSNDESPCDNEADCVWPINFDNHLIVCQDNSRKFILNSNIIELCCSFNAETGACELNNYITVYYKEAATYPNGFNSFNVNERSNKINYINYNNSTFLDSNELNIAANSKIDIQINLDVQNLGKFFMYLEDDDATDQNMLKIVSIDFSHFNSIQITDMTKCFSGCKSLESIDFTDFNSENLESIDYMFEDCHLLKSLDLTNFNTEKIEDMSMAFKGCKSLEILDLFNFNTESVINFDEMFRDCESLKFLDISNFHFVGAYNDIFYGAVNLKYINAKNVIVDEYYDLPLYTNNNNDLIICQNEGNNHFESIKGLDNIYYFCCTFNTDTDMCESNNYIEVYYNEDCNYVFSNNNRNDIVFINYNDKTFAPSAILNILANTKLQINFDTPITSLEKFFSQDVDEYMNKVVSIDFSHFDSSSLINMDSVFYGCSALKSLNLSTFQTTLVTSMNYLFYNCASLEILDISNFNMAQTTNAQDMFFGVNNLIFINLYNTQDNDKIASSSLNTDIEKKFYICQVNEIITNLNSINCCSYPNIASCNAESKEIAVNYNSIITNIESKDFKVVKTENSIIQFSTVKEQMTNTDNTYSSIDLGDCEDKIRQQEGLSESEEFLIVKVDIKNSTTNAVYVQYEIYNPNTNSKVPLEVCKDDTIKIQVPVSLTKEELSLIESFNDYDYNIFDLEDDFYNDVCTKYTSENGADMVLSSRKNLVYDKLKDNYYCQKGCDFGGLNTKSSKAECHCKVQETITITDISEISFDKKEFFDGFYSTLFNSNFRVFKCIKLLFSIDGIKSNYGFYSMTFLLASFITFVIIQIKTGYIKIIKILKRILKAKVMNEKQTINNIEEKKANNEQNNENKEIKMNKKTFRRKSTSKLRKKKTNITKINELQAPSKRNLIKKKSRKSIKSENQNMIYINNMANIGKNMINTTEEINKETIAEKEEDIKEKKENQNNKKTDQEILNEYKGLTYVEMNDLDYEIAIVVDKRTYWQLYISLIKKDHPIIFTFCNRNDYNLIYIKIILFIVSFALFFAINALFFTDETMNNIYEDNGVFNFIFQIPQILYSSFISSVINIILQKLSISEGQILDMKKEKNKEKAKNMANNIRKNLKLKLIIFLVLSSTLILVFWYFISCFCCVYKNTQLILIQDTLISFFASMIYPFIFKLFPGMFRIPALRAKNRDEKCKYKIGKILNLI